MITEKEKDRAHSWVNKKIPLIACAIDRLHKGRLERANISRLYKRELGDWIVLCKGCHTIFDFFRLSPTELKRRMEARKVLLKRLENFEVDFSVNSTQGFYYPYMSNKVRGKSRENAQRKIDFLQTLL